MNNLINWSVSLSLVCASMTHAQSTPCLSTDIGVTRIKIIRITIDGCLLNNPVWVEVDPTWRRSVERLAPQTDPSCHCNERGFHEARRVFWGETGHVLGPKFDNDFDRIVDAIPNRGKEIAIYYQCGRGYPDPEATISIKAVDLSSLIPVAIEDDARAPVEETYYGCGGTPCKVAPRATTGSVTAPLRNYGNLIFQGWLFRGPFCRFNDEYQRDNGDYYNTLYDLFFVPDRELTYGCWFKTGMDFIAIYKKAFSINGYADLCALCPDLCRFGSTFSIIDQSFEKDDFNPCIVNPSLPGCSPPDLCELYPGHPACSDRFIMSKISRSMIKTKERNGKRNLIVEDGSLVIPLASFQGHLNDPRFVELSISSKSNLDLLLIENTSGKITAGALPSENKKNSMILDLTLLKKLGFEQYSILLVDLDYDKGRKRSIEIEFNFRNKL